MGRVNPIDFTNLYTPRSRVLLLWRCPRAQASTPDEAHLSMYND